MWALDEVAVQGLRTALLGSSEVFAPRFLRKSPEWNSRCMISCTLNQKARLRTGGLTQPQSSLQELFQNFAQRAHLSHRIALICRCVIALRSDNIFGLPNKKVMIHQRSSQRRPYQALFPGRECLCVCVSASQCVCVSACPTSQCASTHQETSRWNKATLS